MPMLEVRNLCVKYGVLEAVRDVSFELEKGQIVALIGSNGAGKSTTLNAMMGLVSPSGGQVIMDGQEVQNAPPSGRVKIGMAMSPEGRRLFGRMTVLDNLLVGAYSIHSNDSKQKTLEYVYSLFPRVRERKHQLAGSLSGGEQQMVAIGRALMAQPRVLMLDEPSLGIAPKVVADIALAINRLNQEQGMSIVLVEQNARLALRLAHHAYALEHGAIVLSGSGQEMLENPSVKKAYLGV